MHESHPKGGDQARGGEEIERAMAEFMRATDTFLASWTDAIRRFADEPVALRQFRQARAVASPRRSDEGTSSAAGGRPAFADFPHPLWDRELDG
jgi:hypothetical protein